MATPQLTLEVGRLADAHRAAQSQRAAVVALLVAQYFRVRVNVEDEQSIQRWLDIMVPRIMAEHRRSGTLAAAFASAVRRLELPDADPFTFPAITSINEDQVRRSLLVVGPGSYRNKATQIRGEDERQFDASDKQGLLNEARQVAAQRVAAATSRHVQNGGRQSIYEGIKADPRALGYLRLTRANPCAFCAMLASRGIVYKDDSFEDSDPRFTGDGNAKVHDNCSCALKPVYKRDDPLLDRSKEFERMWREFSGGKGGALLNFRRGYEGRASA